MRDILVTLIVFASLPLILKNPATGVLMWVWISVMNPHTQGWGFATTFPFAFIIAVTTMLSLVMTPGRKTLPMTGFTWLLLCFVAWMNVTTLFAIFPDAAASQWGKVMKIMIMTLVTLMVIRDPGEIHKMIWVLVISVGFYGVKGGIFTLRSGGVDRVWGPEGTFIGGNNEIALALIMTIPLMLYLRRASGKRWIRHGMVAAMLLSGLAALGSYSRGALLAICAMLGFLWVKSSNKLVAGTLLAAAAPLFLLFMPDQWSNRMDTIGDYQEDESAMGRINAWNMAWNLARERFFGGGYEIAEPYTFAMYAPNPADVHAAHSIYFQVLGEHGFIGLALYLLLGLSTWRSAAWIVRRCRRQPTMAWAADLSAMIQCSMIGFAVGGAFLSLAYYDVPYYLMAVIVALRLYVQKNGDPT